MKRKKLLMIGGMPPPYQGQPIAFSAAVDAAGDNYEIKIIDFSRRTKGLKYILNLISFIIQVPSVLIFFQPEKIYFLCSRSFFGGLRDIYLLMLFRFSNATIYNHLHGSDFDEYFNSKSKLSKKFIKFLYSRVNHHAVLIEGMQEQLLSITSSKNIHVINNFFEDFDECNVRKRNENQSSYSISICFLSSICRSKGVFDAIDAFKIFNCKHKKSELLIAGSSIDDEFGDSKSYDEEILQETKFEKNISYLGELNKTQKYNLLRKTDIFCLPSKFRSEAVPLAIIEAMAAGCVIVVYDHKYLSKIVRNGKNGFVILENSPEELAKCFLNLATNKSLRDQISKFNKTHAYTNFSEKKYKSEILNFLRN